MAVRLENLLDELGLVGGYQVHIAPVVLVVDERAHQIFRGFGGEEWQVLRGDLVKKWGDAARVWVGGDGERVEQALGDCDGGDFVILPGKAGEFPGGVYGLVRVVDRLLGPGGCPWDQEQTHESLKKYLLEESYELIEAIDQGDETGMVEELGDVLLQPLMHTQKKRLEGKWDIEDVAKGITEKLVRRHPHVFGEEVAEDSAEVLRNWDRLKKAEKGEGKDSVLAGVPMAMPALLRAMEVSKRAARAGFEWESIEGVWEKFEEERREVVEALESGDQEAVRDEFGDLLFTVVNLARWSGVDAEDALRVMVERFRRRFMRMEELAGERELRELSVVEWDELWEKAKLEG